MLFLYSVKPAIFDLFLAAGIVAYLGVVYVVVMVSVILLSSWWVEIYWHWILVLVARIQYNLLLASLWISPYNAIGGTSNCIYNIFEFLVLKGLITMKKTEGDNLTGIKNKDTIKIIELEQTKLTY